MRTKIKLINDESEYVGYVPNHFLGQNLKFKGLEYSYAHYDAEILAFTFRVTQPTRTIDAHIELVN